MQPALSIARIEQVLPDRYRAPLVRYRWLLTPLFVFVLTRGVLFVGAYFARSAFLEQIPSGAYHIAPNNLLIDVWDRWDSSYYRGIAVTGYEYATQPGDPGNVVFFPVYPLLLRAALVVVQRPPVAGILVSNGCFLLALIFLYRLAQFEFADHATSRRTLFYLAIFPTSFFFSAVYSESTFLLFSVGTVYFVRRRWWIAAGLMGAIATATRVPGILLYGFALIEWLRVANAGTWIRDRGSVLRALRRHWKSLFAIQFIPLGLVAYMFFLDARFGDPLAFVAAQGAWGRHGWTLPYKTIWHGFLTVFHMPPAGNPLASRVALDASLSLGAILLSFFVARRLGLSYGLYTLLAVLLPAGTGNTMSMSRYIAVIFPLFMLLATWGRSQWVDRLVTVVFLFGLGLLTTVFVNWGFVA